MTVLTSFVALVRKELLAVLKDPANRLILVVPVIVQSLVFGYAATYDLVNVPYVLMDDSRSVASHDLVARLDAAGVFRGGAIFPGPRSMGRALRDYTAKLPLVDVTERVGDYPPGTNTVAAIRLGIEATVVAGVNSLICYFADLCPAVPRVFVTGGAAAVLDGYRGPDWEPVHEPALNLLGIRHVAETLP